MTVITVQSKTPNTSKIMASQDDDNISGSYTFVSSTPPLPAASCNCEHVRNLAEAILSKFFRLHFRPCIHIHNSLG